MTGTMHAVLVHGSEPPPLPPPFPGIINLSCPFLLSFSLGVALPYLPVTAITLIRQVWCLTHEHQPQVTHSSVCITFQHISGLDKQLSEQGEPVPSWYAQQ